MKCAITEIEDAFRRLGIIDAKKEQFVRQRIGIAIFYSAVWILAARVPPAFGTPGSTIKSWRGRDGANATEPVEAPVPPLENDQYFPPFSITWPHAWTCIANGEWAIRDHLACPLADPQIPVGYPRGRQFEYRRLRGRLDLNCRPVGAVSA